MPTEAPVKESSAISISLSDLWKILKSKIIWILLITVLFGAVGVLYTSTLDPTYTSTSMYTVYAHQLDNNGNVIEDSTGNSSISTMTATQISISRVLKDAYVQEILSTTKLPRAIRTWLIVKYGYTDKTAPSVNTIRQAIKVSSEENSFLFNVAITTNNKSISSDINLAFGEIVSGVYKSDPAYDVLRAVVKEKIAPIKDDNLAAFKNALSEIGVTLKTDDDYLAFSESITALLQNLGINDQNEIPSYTVEDVDYTCAYIPGSNIYFRDASISTKTDAVSKIYIVISVLAGFVLAYLFFLIMKIVDTKIRTEEDLSSVCHYPVLASIPAINTPIAPKGEDHK